MQASDISDIQAVIPQIPDIRVLDAELSCAAGLNRAALRAAIAQGETGLRANDLPHSGLPTYIGRVAAVDDVEWPPELREWQSRNNALASICLQQPGFQQSVRDVSERFGAARVGIVVGTSTSGIDRTETAYRSLSDDGQLREEFVQEYVHNPHAPGLFAAKMTGISGPAMTISTACSSSAKVFATAARWLACDLVDAVLVGGVDTLCLTVLHGFHSLQLVSESPCRPFDARRDGINLGEAAGYAILVRADAAPEAAIKLAGYGESSDAHHMSHPHPEGLGAELAMRQAIAMAGLEAADIDYINLHGTASKANDLIEGAVMNKLFGAGVKASSTKGWTGHTLGAAGITESIIAIDALLADTMPGTLNYQTPDADIPCKILQNSCSGSLRRVMSNSFGFGGNNCSLVFEKVSGARAQ